ncbi:MAG: CusA/CzcA family heavy metal efflux RND transporter [Cytophagia bacterium]|nr:MAG: CusA/CzcA family heavy metal efflux RND transporter [Cytophagales bacterium]TAG34544.1 MAG: CusA/CzcA family heavy metal efflux RND transporter [Cytophagia bacterium]TAG76689.1 MAG: CusA/CzcA family heavy metal efflux RND transporter [Cytophagales bacterium]
MIDSLIFFSIKNKLIVTLCIVALIGWGGFSLTQLPVDAVPDITTNQIQILTPTPTLAAQEVEQFITTPLELSMANIPNVTEIRSVSKQGLSVITLVFKDDADILQAKQWVSEQLVTVSRDIPAEFGKPAIAPLTTGLGEIYQYTIVPKKGYETRYDLTELRSIQDWIVKRQLAGIEGVIETSSFGGFVKQYEVSVNPERLRALNVTIGELFETLQTSNANTGGSYIEKADQAYFIRGEGVVKTVADIENSVVRTQAGVPLLIKDVATVRFGHAMRFGALTRNGQSEVVGGVVLMLKGANSAETVGRVKERVAQIQKSLPEGLRIEPFIERTKLINKTISTVTENLLLGGLIVVFVLVLLMGSLRAGLIAASVIPLAMLFTIGMMKTFGISANLMSLGAIDFGVIVDGAVIIVEAIVYRFQQQPPPPAPPAPDGGAVLNSPIGVRGAIVYETARKIRHSAAFGEIIILMVYLPILSLVGIEGKMFRPMALTVGFAIFGAFVLSLTYVPMVCAVFLGTKSDVHWAISEKILNALYKVYEPAIRFSLRFPKSILAATLALFVVCLFIFGKLGGEFIPTLDEGDLAIDFRTAPGTSLTRTVEASLEAHRALLKHFPEVKQIVGRIGASEIPTDPMPIEMVDQMINMKDISDWTNAKNRDEMSEKMAEVIAREVPGTTVEMTQPIQMRFNEMITGVRSDVVVKIYGNDLDLLFERANACVPFINQVTGVASVRVEQLVGLPQISIDYDRAKMAQYGLKITDANRLVRAAFAGETAGTVYEAERRYDLVVRLDSSFRKDIENVRQLHVPLPNGGGVPLSQIAKIDYKQAPAQISHDNTRRRITLGIAVRGRDVESVVNDIQRSIEAQVKLPSGYYYTYGGAFQNLQEAKKRLTVAVPIALFLIFVLLYFTFNSFKESLLIFTAVPLSAIGGILALWARDLPFSISAGVGFIALFGVAVLNGIVLIAYLKELEEEGSVANLKARIMKAVQVRFRPVIMTATVASLGFLPMALSTSGGAEVQRPLATVVIGGILSATLLTLIVLPILYEITSPPARAAYRPDGGVQKGKGGRGKIEGSKGLFFILFLVVNQAFGQTISLPVAVEMAAKNNGNLQATQLEIGARRALIPVAFDLPRTNVDVLMGQIQNRPLDYTASVMQAFAPRSVYKAQERLLQSQVGLAEKQYVLSKNEVTFRVKEQYYQLLYLYQLSSWLRSQNVVYTNAAKAAQLRFQTGETNRLEAMALETRQRETQNRLAATLSDLAVGYRQLQALLFSNEPFQIDTLMPLKRPITSNLAVFIADDNALVGLLKQQTEVSRQLTETEQQRQKPDWRVGVANQSIEQRLGFTYLQGGIGIPLFTKAQKARVEAAKIGQKVAEKQQNNAAVQLEAIWQALQQELTKYQNSLNYYEQSALPQADLLLQTALKNFNAGEIDYVEFFQNTQQAGQIREGHWATLLNYSLVVIQMEKLRE